jgi:arylsulfatase A-like enzyme
MTKASIRFFTLLFTLASLSLSASAADSRPNILFVFTDDHASHAISAYGSKLNQTPNIDRLAKEGMIFRNCFVGNSICAPSRATILTGKHTHQNGQIDNRVTFDGSQQTFPKLLRNVGYQTAIVGKWHLKSEPTGFDFWKVLVGQGPYYNPPLRTPEGVVNYTGYTTDILTDITLDWLQEKRDPSKPFMLMYQHKAPHREWAPGPDHLHTYDDVTMPEPHTLFDDYKGRTTAAGKQEMTISEHMNDRDLKLVPPGNLTPEQLSTWLAAYEPKNDAFRAANLQGADLVRWKYQRYIKDYLRSIASVDDNLGRVLDYLDKAGLAKNTVVIYNSDQGFYLGDKGWFDKRWMYEESFRAPLLVRWPGMVDPGAENKDLVQNIDFASTFLEIAGARVPDDLQGRSLVPLLKGSKPTNWRKSLYYHYYEYPAVHMVQRHYGVRTGRYKLIHYYPIGEWEMFDLLKDPFEMKNLYKAPEYQDEIAELKTELTRLRKEYKVEEFKEPPLPPDPQKAKLERVVHLTFNGPSKPADKIWFGRKGRTREFDGKQKQTHTRATSPDPAYKPFVAGAWVNPAADSGVILAQGGAGAGYSLYLAHGIPHIGIRSNGRLYEAKGAGKVRPGEWTHLAGRLNKQGQLQLLVNGRPSGASVKAKFLTGKPNDSFSLAADTGSPVNNYPAGNAYKGLLEDVRIYWGELGEGALRAWAD